jgi:broad specificity phosphatase PhoE
LLGEYLSDENFTTAFSSDYARTVETAAIILSKSKKSSNLKAKKDELIRERVSHK